MRHERRSRPRASWAARSSSSTSACRAARPSRLATTTAAPSYKSVEAIAAAAAESGVRLALEVIPNDLSTPAALDDLLERRPRARRHRHLPRLRPRAHDVGRREAAETLAGHLITTHVHDNDGRSDDHLVPFAGTIDWPTTLMAM